jgi:hypothetical protein
MAPAGFRESRDCPQTAENGRITQLLVEPANVFALSLLGCQSAMLFLFPSFI